MLKQVASKVLRTTQRLKVRLFFLKDVLELGMACWALQKLGTAKMRKWILAKIIIQFITCCL